MYLNIITLIVAGVVNTYAETLLTTASSFSAIWGTAGVFVIVIWDLTSVKHWQDPSFVFLMEGYNNNSGWTSMPFVCLVGTLAAASTFTGYDTAAHLSEETQVSHSATPLSMIFSTINTLVVGLILIAGMNFCVQDYDSLLPNINDDNKQENKGEIIHDNTIPLTPPTKGKVSVCLYQMIQLGPFSENTIPIIPPTHE